MIDAIHQAFSQAANNYPDNTAIWSETGSISYSQLTQRSDALAVWLTERLSGSGHRVALVMPKCIESVMAILAILKSGNTYVPLGDNWSVGRLDKIFADGDFSLSITDSYTESSEQQHLPTAKSVLVTGSTEWQHATEKNHGHNCNLPSVTADDLAYILYTSGSTGVPKGVCVSHRGAAYFPTWAGSEFSVSSKDRIASVSPLTFDLSTFDIFTTLGTGATLYIVPEKLKVFPAQFSGFLQDHNITCLYAVPSTLILLAQRGKLAKRNLSALRTVLFAGEIFPVPHFLELRELLPDNIEYANLYGPTETNVCTFYRVPPDFSQKTIPIGFALPGTHLFTRQETTHQQEEQTGELCVAGPAVMSGYFGQTDNTANYWLDDPQGSEHRAYATGDQATLTGDGLWHYHGRLDKMVKIWGYRVELGEVESCLLDLPLIEQAAVVKRSSDSSGGDALVAFIIYNADQNKPDDALPNSDAPNSITTDAQKSIIDHCKSNLPPYMVPKEISVLTKMPLNSTGKIDRLKLEKFAADQEA